MIIAIDPGHGGTDPGAVYGQLKEKDIVLNIALRLNAILLTCPFIDPIITRDEDVSVSLAQRTRIANAIKADYFISIHTNAAGEEGQPTGAKGSEIWVYPGSKKSKEAAMVMADWVNMTFPDEPFRGIKQAPFYVLKYTRMPAGLIELAFINNSDSSARFASQKSRNEMALTLALGLFTIAHEFYTTGQTAREE